MTYLVPTEGPSRADGFILPQADIERWWEKHKDYFWNKDVGMYRVGAIRDSMPTIVEPSDDQLSEIDTATKKTLDKPKVAMQVY